MELIRTKVYEKRINKLLTPKEREEAENEIAGDPTVWPVIKGSGGVRKTRFGRDDTGKSGGGRIGYVFWEAFDTLYLLAASSGCVRKEREGEFLESRTQR